MHKIILCLPSVHSHPFDNNCSTRFLSFWSFFTVVSIVFVLIPLSPNPFNPWSVFSSAGLLINSVSRLGFHYSYNSIFIIILYAATCVCLAIHLVEILCFVFILFYFIFAVLSMGSTIFVCWWNILINFYFWNFFNDNYVFILLWVSCKPKWELIFVCFCGKFSSFGLFGSLWITKFETAYVHLFLYTRIFI